MTSSGAAAGVSPFALLHSVQLPAGCLESQPVLDSELLQECDPTSRRRVDRSNAGGVRPL